MSIFSDFRFWIFAVSICQTALMISGFMIIKYNDFVHLKKDVDEIIANVKEINSKVQDIDKITAIHEQRLNDL